MLLDGCQSGEVQPAVVIPFSQVVSFLLDSTERRPAEAVQLQGHDRPILCSYLHTNARLNGPPTVDKRNVLVVHRTSKISDSFPTPIWRPTEQMTPRFVSV